MFVPISCNKFSEKWRAGMETCSSEMFAKMASYRDNIISLYFVIYTNHSRSRCCLFQGPNQLRKTWCSIPLVWTLLGYDKNVVVRFLANGTSCCFVYVLGSKPLDPLMDNWCMFLLLCSLVWRQVGPSFMYPIVWWN